MRWTLKPLAFIVLLVLILTAGQATVQLYRDKSHVRHQLGQTQVEYKKAESDRLKLLKQSQDLKNQNTDIQKQLNQKAQEEQQLQQQIKDLQAAKAANQNQYIALAPSAAAAAEAAPTRASGVVGGCGDNSMAQFIYQNESGCKLDAQNAGGCLGIGQACPGSKLLNICPDLNYGCQNSFFTDYANRAYGGWAGAYAFWQANGWW